MMQLDAPERDVPAGPAVLRLPRAALLVVAGVPGAGKTTLLSRIDAPGSLVLDPEPIRVRFQRLLGRVPYRLWRPLVHAEHFLRVLVALPGPSGLIVHDTGTRGWRRRLLVGLARRCGRTGHLLLLDVTAEAALEGQRRRRRTLRRSGFATHWQQLAPAPGRPRPGLQPRAGPPAPAPRPRARQPPPPGRHPPPLMAVGGPADVWASAPLTSPTSGAGAVWWRPSSSPGWEPRAARWLDVGCGTGALSAADPRHVPPAARDGVDPSAGFLADAGAAARLTASVRSGPTPRRCRLGDAPVDGVVSGWC